MLNSAIQLDLNFNFSRMNLLDKVFVASKISLTYIKSLFIQFSKDNRFIFKSNVLVPPNNLFSDIYECDRGFCLTATT